MKKRKIKDLREREKKCGMRGRKNGLCERKEREKRKEHLCEKEEREEDLCVREREERKDICGN